MVQDGGQVLHAEPGGTFTPVWVVLAVMALGTAIDAVVRNPGDALSIVVAGTTVLIPVGLYVASKRRYGRLEVTRDTLRIGKERLPLADLDPEPLEEQAAGQRYTGTPGGWFGDRASDVRVAGGAWGPAVGDRYVIVKVRGQPGYAAVPTADPPRLARLLADLVSEAGGAREG